MSKHPAVILAGGKASRLGGGDKGLLSLGNGTVLDHVIARLAPQCGPIALNANGDPTRFKGLKLPVLPDSEAEQPGPLAGILAAMDWAASLGAPMVVTVAADTPFFPRDLVARFEQHEGGVIASSGIAGEPASLHPVFGLWPTAWREDLRRDLRAGERKVRYWARQHGVVEEVFLHGGADPFFNINTPEDLRQARALARGDQCFRMK